MLYVALFIASHSSLVSHNYEAKDCGNVRLPVSTMASFPTCETQCTADANEFCGGPGANLVYFLPSAVNNTQQWCTACNQTSLRGCSVFQ